MQHDPLSPDLISELRSNFDRDFLRSNWTSFDLSRREEHNGDNIVALGLIGSEVSEEKLLC